MTDTPLQTGLLSGPIRINGTGLRAILRRIGWGGLPLAIALPCAFGTGAMVYLTLPVEPVRLAVPMLACASVLFVAALVLARTRTALPLALLVLAFAIAGYARAEWRTHALDHTILADRDRARTVTGWIEDVQRSGPWERLVIRVATIEGVDAPPPRIRVTASRGEFGPGDAITLRAVLGPPPRPAAPGGYDSGFASWYAGIGGSGFAVSRPAEAEVAMDAGRRRFAAWRWSIAERVRAQMPARSGGVAAALLTGDRSGIDPDDAEALRAAGLGHILAISGLHMALMAGGVFFAVTALFARIEPLARAIDPRQPAAIVALIAATGYLVLSGAAIPTQRAFVMTAVVLLGVLSGRRAASLHLVGLAALAVLLFQPESIVTPGFQMSFAAATALIAAFSMARRPASVPAGPIARFGRFWTALAGSSLIAGLATAGFAAFHFHRLAAYGFGANLAAMPVFSLLVMPAGAIALLLMPLGLEGPVLWVMGKGIEWVLWVSAFAHGMPGSLTPAAAAPGSALAVYAAGFVLFVAGRGGARLFGGALIALSFLFWATAQRPHALISDGGVMIARFGDSGDWSVSNRRRSRFATTVFLERSGAIGQARPDAGVTCDAIGCAGVVHGWRVAFPETAEGLAEDCRSADLVVTRFRVRSRDRESCDAHLVDANQLDSGGALSVWFGQDRTLRTVSVQSVRGERVWTQRGDPADG